MSLDELQKKVDRWIQGIGGYWNEFEIFARLTEEVGELASDLQREKGLRPRNATTNLKGEVGDVLFTLLAFANKMEISVTEAMEETFAKYDLRDVDAWKEISREKIYSNLDRIISHCKTSGKEEWQKEYSRRVNPVKSQIPTDEVIMQRFCIAIAYSQGSRSKLINALIKTKVFNEAFMEFDFKKLAKADPETILEKHWGNLRIMRFRSKIEKIVQCAQFLVKVSQKYGSFAKFLGTFKIPRKIDSDKKIELFWKGFDSLQKELNHQSVPFFRHTTSLLQLLLDLDFDSVKPDLIIMRLCKKLGIVEKELGDKHFRRCVRFLQEYAVSRKTSALSVDFALLAFGGQTWAGSLLKKPVTPEIIEEVLQ